MEEEEEEKVVRPLFPLLSAGGVGGGCRESNSKKGLRAETIKTSTFPLSLLSLNFDVGITK